jgi:multimeric flavodoxin WrbA
VRCAFDGVLGRKAALCAVLNDGADYDLVIVGTPVWGRSVSTPVHTYLERTRGQAP